MSIKKFNKASIAMAVAGALAASSAQAVNIAEDGLGEFILAPYYTVRDGWNTYINVTNTSDETVIFKIRFRESRNSRDVRDFNVVLSPYDVWTAALVQNAAGGAKIVTHDNTCVAPLIMRDGPNGDRSFTSDNPAVDPRNFTSGSYTGQFADGGPTDIARTTEGYFEVINSGQDSDQTDTKNSTAVAAWAKHNSSGQPADCVSVSNAFTSANFDAYVKQVFDEPENSLKVNVSLINVNDGMGISYEPVTLANFYNPAIGYTDGVAPAPNNIIFPPDSDQPNIANVSPAISEIRTDTVGVNVVSNWARAGDAVSALFMRNAVINQYRSDTTDPAADTDWVVTFPTKWAYTDGGNWDLYDPQDPFVEEFPSAPNVGESCVRVVYNHWDREEMTPEGPSEEVLPSPYIPTEAVVDELCDEVNVLQFGDGVVGAAKPYDPASPFKAGWLRLDLGLDYRTVNGIPELINTITDTNGVVYQGLPVIGTAVSNLDNPTLGNENVQYGFAWNHSYTRAIVGSAGATYTTNGLPAGTFATGTSGI